MKRQWHADLWHLGARLPHPNRLTAPSSREFVWRALGVFRHAFLLRIHEWSLAMLSFDLKHGIKMWSRRPARFGQTRIGFPEPLP